MIPLMAAIGVAVDYSQAANVRTKMQAAIDAAVLAGARDGTQTWNQTAVNFFNTAQFPSSASVESPVFTGGGDETYTGKVSAKVKTNIVGFLGFSSIPVSVTAKAASGGVPDDSCLLTLDRGQPISNVSMTFNGSPDVKLTYCALRSNTSMKCNGHNTNASASIAAGTATGCSNPRSYANPIPDVYSQTAENITKLCGGLAGGATWTPNVAPPGLKTVSTATHTEYHVCGDLTLSGKGSLAGLSSNSDSIIVIENGSLIIDDKSSISTSRTAFVLTGNNGYASSISFPNGNGKESTLALSPPTTEGNPWKGLSLYQDPSLTKSVDNDWGPGTNLVVDGIVYLPNSHVTIRGASASNISRCTKIVVNRFTLNGSVDFVQTEQGCTNLGVKKWSDVKVHLVQ